MTEAPSSGRIGWVSRNVFCPRGPSYWHVFFSGLALRLVYLWQASGHNEILGYPIVDANVYVSWARDILAGHVLWSEPINYTPAYPFYLAGWLWLLGDAWRVIFIFFHLLGALQAVAIGRVAEALWDRKTGLLAGFIAALYWPFVVIEASFFCENLALWTLAAGLFFFVRHVKRGGIGNLLAAGAFVGVAGLCRANMLLCLPVMAAWLAWDSAVAGSSGARAGRVAMLRGLRNAAVFLAPVIVMAAPVSLWNLHRVGSPMLRTQGGICFYIGNDPRYDGLIMPPGVEYDDLSNEPLRADQSGLHNRERFWFRKTLSVVKNRPGAWLVLQARKLAMNLGAFEISQEIDVYRFRGYSSILALPAWPGFGFLAPLAVAGIFLAVRLRQRAAVPLILFAAAYFVSMFPFQAASRFRLPLALALIPFAGHAIAAATAPAFYRDRRRLAAGLLGLAAFFVLLAPDYTHARKRNVIRHEYFVGEKRYHAGDMAGALRALSESAAKYPSDADSLLLAGDIHVARKEIGEAGACFREAAKRQPRNARALMGLARCAIIATEFDEAKTLLQRCLAEWPNSMDALMLLNDVHFLQADWPAAELALLQMHTYVSCPVKMTFRLALVRERLGKIGEAVAVYDRTASDPLRDEPDRARAAFSAAALLWRYGLDRDGAVARWKTLASGTPGFYSRLAARLAGASGGDDLVAACDPASESETRVYACYTLGLAAWMKGDIAGARARFEETLAVRHARELKPWRLLTPEFWAMTDLARINAEEPTGS